MNRLKSMSSVFAGFVIGALVAAVFLLVYSGILRKSAERQLIDNWRKFQPGMLFSKVETILGKPNGQFPLGNEFPSWAEELVPKDFYRTHGLVTYVISGIGPQVLLIYIDNDDRVAFVSSTTT